jgi:predicted DNA-binding transcriptional regulator AlpA
MPETTSNDEFLTKRELARLCRCSERTIDRLLEEGDAPPVTRLSSRRIIFPAASARQWLSNRTVGLGRQSPEGAVWASDTASRRKSPKQQKARRGSMGDMRGPVT